MKLKHYLLIFMILLYSGFLNSTNTKLKTERDLIKKRLLAFGAKQIKIYKNFDEYLFFEEILCQIEYDLNLSKLSKIVFYMSPKKYKKRLCVPIAKYQTILSFFNKIYYFGKFFKEDPISIVIRRGWIKKTLIYKNVLIIINKKNLYHLNSKSENCISQFTIQFILKISGNIESKFVEKDIYKGNWSLPVFVIKISNYKIEVEEDIYKQLSIGDEVSFKVINIGNKRYISKEEFE